MGVKYDQSSLAEKHERRKSLEDLTRENKELRDKLQTAEESLTSTQVALCEVYELLMGGGV